MGPPSDNRQQSVFSSLLRETDRPGSFLPGPRVRVETPTGLTPLAYMESLLRDLGLKEAEELRAHFKLPEGRWLVAELALNRSPIQPVTATHALFPAHLEPILASALILGLCNQAFYDLSRPVIWTNQRLARRLQLFQPKDFYED